MEIVIYNLKHATMIATFVFAAMLTIDYLNVLTKGDISTAIRGGRYRQYILASFLGATPGCIGAFMNVSFYIRGLISFGAIAGGMIATSGDSAFVMLAMFPTRALVLFGILFVLGVIFAFVIDRIAPLLKIKLSQKCQLSGLHGYERECRIDFKNIPVHLKKISMERFLILIAMVMAFIVFFTDVLGLKHFSWEKAVSFIFLLFSFFIVLTSSEHYLAEHIWKHIVKMHLWKIFLWSFGALLIVDLSTKFWNLQSMVKAHIFWMIFIAAFLAIIPETGPYLVFVTLFAKGIIPFSVLLASSIVHDGHGMFPLLSYSVRDSLLIKLFNLTIALGLGILLYSLGL